MNSKGFEIDFEVSSNNTVRKITLNDFNLNINLDLISISEGLNFPMSIVSSIGSDNYFAANIVEVRNDFYEVDASDLNMPLANRIGDIQINSNNK